MEPIFTMQYGEFAVADYLAKRIKNASVFIPASAQEKGIDLLLYRHENGRNTTNTIQVKMSRTYYDDEKKTAYPYHLWFNRFKIQKTQIGTFLLAFMLSARMILQQQKQTVPAGTQLCLPSRIKKCKHLWQKLNRKRILQRTI